MLPPRPPQPAAAMAGGTRARGRPRRAAPRLGVRRAQRRALRRGAAPPTASDPPPAAQRVSHARPGGVAARPLPDPVANQVETRRRSEAAGGGRGASTAATARARAPSPSLRPRPARAAAAHRAPRRRPAVSARRGSSPPPHPPPPPFRLPLHHRWPPLCQRLWLLENALWACRWGAPTRTRRRPPAAPPRRLPAAANGGCAPAGRWRPPAPPAWPRPPAVADAVAAATGRGGVAAGFAQVCDQKEKREKSSK
ncbi:hypothetical protein I4F81_005525 [Pyropia yezoensis]|uniref:Uncharacterized protein n=1 Tax=Pyropia yezoensis TaxID=2788 RepID=A0ACC3BZ29_PYRYE|nr:hypothetical protein I4F81_005525 [Neopyropia yezoensis]